jgi:hypothetical protein
MKSKSSKWDEFTAADEQDEIKSSKWDEIKAADEKDEIKKK